MKTALVKRLALLIKKSHGVKAEVTIKNSNTYDPDMGNNQKTHLI